MSIFPTGFDKVSNFNIYAYTTCQTIRKSYSGSLLFNSFIFILSVNTTTKNLICINFPFYCKYSIIFHCFNIISIAKKLRLLLFFLTNNLIILCVCLLGNMVSIIYHFISSRFRYIYGKYI